MIYPGAAKNGVNAKTLLCESDVLNYATPKSISEFIQKFNKKFPTPVAVNSLFEMACSNCESFRVNAKVFYRWRAEAVDLYYGQTELLEKEIMNVDGFLEELSSIAQSITVPLVVEDPNSIGICTGHDDWDYDQNTGYPLILLNVCSIWIGDMNCAACKLLRVLDKDGPKLTGSHESISYCN